MVADGDVSDVDVDKSSSELSSPRGDRTQYRMSMESSLDMKTHHQANGTGAQEADRNNEGRQEGCELTVAQKRFLVERGFDMQELDAMRFPSYKDSYAWWAEHMRSPNKRKSTGEPRQPPSNKQKLSPNQIPLTLRQKEWLMSCGYDPNYLDSLRFSSVPEGYRWVGRASESDYSVDPFGEYYDDHSHEDDLDSIDELVDSLNGLEEEELNSLCSTGSISSSSGSSHDEEMEPVQPNANVNATRQSPGPVVDLTQESPVNNPNLQRRVDDNPSCGICFEPMGANTDRHMAAGSCGHVYCRHCLTKAVQARRKCPACSKRLNIRSIRNIYLDT